MNWFYRKYKESWLHQKFNQKWTKEKQKGYMNSWYFP